jgi:Fe-S cluster assembly protein SufB
VDDQAAAEVAAAVRQEADAHLGRDLSGIDFDNIKYFVRSTEKQATTWDDLPEDIKNTYDRLGIPEAERKRLVPA